MCLENLKKQTNKKTDRPEWLEWNEPKGKWWGAGGVGLVAILRSGVRSLCTVWSRAVS